MSKKFKDYYDIEYLYSLAEKIKNVYEEFNTEYFIKLIEPTIDVNAKLESTVIA